MPGQNRSSGVAKADGDSDFRSDGGTFERGGAVWHAYAERSNLEGGSALLITGGDEAVDLAIEDGLMIDCPDGQQVGARILLREGDRLVLAISSGPDIELHRVADEGDFSEFKLSDGFSRQVWVVA